MLFDGQEKNIFLQNLKKMCSFSKLLYSYIIIFETRQTFFFREQYLKIDFKMLIYEKGPLPLKFKIIPGATTKYCTVPVLYR